MLTMHDHDPGSSNFLSRSSFQHGNNLLSDAVVKPHHHLHHQSFHHLPQHHAHLRQQNVHHQVDQLQPHHISLQQHQQQQQHSNIHLGTHLPHSFPHHESSTSTPYHHPQQFQPPQSAVGLRRQQDGQHMYHHVFTQSSHLTSSTGSCNMYGNEEEQYEDVDEDDISEVDDEELLRTYEQCRRRIHSHAPDVTSQLLHFASIVSADIQKFFGRSKGHEDGCDIYEDKWAATKSGRELYYADLLRIAQGDSEPISKTTRKTFASTSTSDSGIHSDQGRTLRHSGKRNVSAGIGPLKELFHFGLQKFSSSHKKQYNTKSKGNHGQKSRVTPMQERNFPASFWREPCAMSDSAARVDHQCAGPVFNTFAPHDSGVHSVYTEPCPASAFGDRIRNEQRQGVVMTSSKLPDFTDLMESWQVGGGGGGGGEGLTNTGHDRRQQIVATAMEHQRL